MPLRSGTATALWAGLGVTLVVASVVLPWRTVNRPGTIAEHVDHQFLAGGPAAGLWLFGTATAVLLVEAVALTGGRTRRLLRAAGTVLVVGLGALLVAIAEALTHALDSPLTLDPERGYVRPGPGFLPAAASLLACLAGLWSSRGRPVGLPSGPPPRRRVAGLLLLLGGWGAVGAAMVLPFWRTVHPDQVTLRLGFELSFVVLPLALGGGLASVASLALPGRSAWRQASRGLLLGNALSCGSLTGVGWFLSATDPYAPEHGMVSSGPGAGLFLALLGCLLVPLAGSLPPTPTAH